MSTRSSTTATCSTPVTSAILAKETLLQAQVSYTVPVPEVLRSMWHALPDEIVPFKPAQQYVQKQWAKGANIDWNVSSLVAYFRRVH
jgi:hypothetical protein